MPWPRVFCASGNVYPQFWDPELLRSYWFTGTESVGREAVKEWGKQYDIRHGIAPPTLTLETLIVPPMTPGLRCRASSCRRAQYRGGSFCKMHILIKITFQPNKIALTTDTFLSFLGPGESILS